MTKPGVAYPKVREPQRAQASFHFEVTEDLLPKEHPAQGGATSNNCSKRRAARREGLTYSKDRK
jgi:hypothetical protein